MTRLLPTRWIALPAIVLAVLVVAGFVIQAEGQDVRPPRIAVVVDTSKDPAPGLIDRASKALERAEAAGADAQLRVTHTSTEQLSVTHYLAAKGYDAIVGVNLDRAVAVDPVAAKYPATALTTVAPGKLVAAVTAAAAQR
jgi:basic membrane lipoprotein Med (substrate-binding protein (PBP1-ABC) superfamily)